MAKPTSSFSSSSECWSYDVFLNFRGENTRTGFTDILYRALCEKGVKTFMDDKELRKGEQIKPALMNAIQESRIAIVIFSENYASSTFCLEELVKILECRKTGTLVWPVFYKVDPSDVRNQKGSYAEQLAKLEKRDMDKVKIWELALKEAANLSGWHFKYKPEYEFIQEIIEEVPKRINRSPLDVAKHSVGFESNDGVHMVGIYEEVLELFSRNDLGAKQAKTPYLEFPETVIQSCNGLPLSLEKIGFSICEKRLAIDAYGINLYKNYEVFLGQMVKGERQKEMIERGRSNSRERDRMERDKSMANRSENERSENERRKGEERVEGWMEIENEEVRVERDREREKIKSIWRDKERRRSKSIQRDEERRRSKSRERDQVKRSKSGGRDEERRRCKSRERDDEGRRSKSRGRDEVRSKSRGRDEEKMRSKSTERDEVRRSESRERDDERRRSKSRGRDNERRKSKSRERDKVRRSKSSERDEERRRRKSRDRDEVRSKSRGREDERRSKSKGRDKVRRGKSRERDEVRRSKSRGRERKVKVPRKKRIEREVKVTRETIRVTNGERERR